MSNVLKYKEKKTTTTTKENVSIYRRYVKFQLERIHFSSQFRTKRNIARVIYRLGCNVVGDTRSEI